MRIVVDVKNGDEFVTVDFPSVRWAVYKLTDIPLRICNAIRERVVWADHGKK